MAAIALTVGAILFGGAAGVLGQDGTNLFWDNTAKRMGIGNAAPTVALDVIGTGKFSTSVVTPLVQASAGLVVNANVGDINFQTAGTRRWNILNSTSALQPDQDNVWNFGAATARIASGFFGTSVVTPLVGTDTAASLTFKTNGFAQWQISNLGGGAFVPMADNTLNLGDPAARIAKVFTPIIDSGTTGSLSLKTNNGTEQVRVAHTATAVNRFEFAGAITGASITASAFGSDTNIGWQMTAAGNKGFDFYTGTGNTSTAGAVLQFQVLHTASASRNITVTGSNGGNPTISTTAGSLAITPAVVLASSLNFSTAAGKIIPGATSISLRNNADSADNLLVTDAGVATVRSSLAWGTGIANFGTITKRKTADESVTSSTVLQDDDHLTFAIAANEEWILTFNLAINANGQNTGFKCAVTSPSGSTILASADILTNAGNTSCVQSNTSGATLATFAFATTARAQGFARVLNGATPGAVTLQWAQNTSGATAMTVLAGSSMQAIRVS